MAVSTLFLTDMETLKGRLRLEGVEIGDAAQPIIEGSTRTIRARFYARLGVARVAAILAMTSAENPTTADEVVRALAEEIESRWVWCDLARRMPLKFFDNSGDDLEQFNTEAAFRSIDPDRLQAEIDRCEAEIEAWLPLLDGSVEVGAAQLAKVHTQGEMPGGRPFPLGTLLGGNRNLYGDPGRFQSEAAG